MAEPRSEQHRVIGRGFLQRKAIRVRIVDDVRADAGHEPRARRILRRAELDELDDFLERRARGGEKVEGRVQGHRVRKGSGVERVNVRIVEARNHGLTPQVDELRVLLPQGQDLAARTHCDDERTFDRDAFGPKMRLIRSEDLAVVVDRSAVAGECAG